MIEEQRLESQELLIGHLVFLHATRNSVQTSLNQVLSVFRDQIERDLPKLDPQVFQAVSDFLGHPPPNLLLGLDEIIAVTQQATWAKQVRYRKTFLNRLDEARQGLASAIATYMGSVTRLAQSLYWLSIRHELPQVHNIALSLKECPNYGLMQLHVKTCLEVLGQMVALGGLEKSKLLVVTSDVERLARLEATLAAPSREILHAASSAAAWEIMNVRPVSLILLADNPEDEDPLAFLLSIKGRFSTSRIPMIRIGPGLPAENSLEYQMLGVTAYLAEPVDSLELSLAVAHQLAHGLVNQQQNRHDLLTGLPNKSSFEESFLRTASLLRRSRSPISIAVLEFRNLKEINQQYSHVVGDHILRDAAGVITKTLRSSDFLARWGGSKFLVYFPSTDRKGAVLALRKLLKALKDHEFHVLDHRITEVAFMGGAAEVVDFQPLEEAISHAQHYLHLGQIQSERTPDEVSIPLAEAGVPSLASMIGHAGRSMTIKTRALLVEDDEIIGSVLKYYLEREGFDIHHLADGEAAVEALGNHDYSLVLLDVKLPKVDGFELLQHLRKRPVFHNTPVVMLTSMGREQEIVRGFELGASDYILKPFSPKELLVRIRRLLEDKV